MIKDYVCLDIETTGLDAKFDKIVEIGAVKVRDFAVIDTFSQLINPGCAMPMIAMNVTGITNGMLREQPDIEQTLPSFLEFCGEDIIMGHNIMFDYSFLKRNASYYKYNFNNKGIDTLKLARTLLQHLEKRNLEYICQHYNIINENQHRAYDDAAATNIIYQKMAEIYYEGNEMIFEPRELVYKVKKQSSITDRQKKYLLDLAKYHRIDLEYDVSKLTKGEASKLIDNIILTRGRIL